MVGNLSRIALDSDQMEAKRECRQKFPYFGTPRPRAALPLTPLISKIALFLIGSKSPPIALLLVIFTKTNL